MPATELPQEVAHDVEIDEHDESGPEFDWHCFAELVDHLVDVIRVEHDQEHTAPAKWCEQTICVTEKLWDSFPGLLDVAYELVDAVRAEHDCGHAAPFTFCNHLLCLAAKSVWEARD